MELHDVLDDTADRIANEGTRPYRAILEVLAVAARPLCPAAADALVDWEGSEVARLRAFALVHGVLLRDPGCNAPADEVEERSTLAA